MYNNGGDVLFEWSEEKNMLNKRKHGVWFEEAKRVFFDRQHKALYDHKHSSLEEDRYLAVGFSVADRVLMVAYCYADNEAIRIISARLATKQERRFYIGRRIRLIKNERG